MTDITALAILKDQIYMLKTLPKPPDDDGDIASYENKIQQGMTKASKTIGDVKMYLDHIDGRLKELKMTLTESQAGIKDAIRMVFERLTAIVIKGNEENTPSPNINPGPIITTKSTRDSSYKPTQQKPLSTNPSTKSSKTKQEDSNFQLLCRAQKLEKIAKSLMGDRLNELIEQTEVALAKVKDNSNLSIEDIDSLKGCLDSWKDAKKESYEVEKKQKLEKERQTEEQKRKLEEAETLKQEEAKKREQEKKQLKEEERKKREEEEKRLKEEERKKREEEEKRLKEEERKKREEEEKRLKEEKKKREEEERRLKEEEKKREEEERRLKEEEKKREEEEKAKKLDPNNWPPHTCNIPCDEVDGRRPFHNGVGCIVTSPNPDLKKGSFACQEDVELDDVVDILEEGEKFASSVINLHSKSGPIKSEVPSRIYIPHIQVEHPADEEIVVKYTMNDSDWVTSATVSPTSNIHADQDRVSSSNLIGVELSNFEKIKAVVVIRPKRQTISVDSPGEKCSSESDGNVQIVIPKDTFDAKSEVQLSVQIIQHETLPRKVTTSTPIVTLSCNKPPAKTLEVDIPLPKQEGSRTSRQGQYAGLYFTQEGGWEHAQPSDQRHRQLLAVKLPPMRRSYTIIGLQTPSSMPKEEQLQNAQLIYDQVYKAPVQAMLRQHRDRPTDAVLVIDRTINIKARERQLSSEGYTLGPELSEVHYLRDGQRLHLSISGTIAIYQSSLDEMSITFYAYVKPIWKRLKFAVKEPESDASKPFAPMSSRYTGIYKPQSKATKAYTKTPREENMGRLKITVDNGTEFADEVIKLVVTLPQTRKK